MITAKNYFKEVSVITDVMPSAVREAHDLAVSLNNDGINPFETGDKDIDETMQLLLSEANKLLTKVYSKSEKSPAPGVIVKRTAARKSKPTKTRSKSAQNNNKAKAKPPVKKIAPKKVESTAKKRLTPKVNKIYNYKGRKAEVRESGNRFVVWDLKHNANFLDKRTFKTRMEATAFIKENKMVLITPKKKTEKAPVTVKKLSKELQFIKQFVGMNGKKYTLKAIEQKHTALFNFLPLIVDHKTVVKEIWERVGKAVSAMKKAAATDINIKIEKDFVDKCNSILSGATVRMRTEFLSGVKGTTNEPVNVLYKKAKKLFNEHINNEGKLDYSEKEYAYLMDAMDEVEIGYFHNKPGGDYQHDLAENGYSLTKTEAVKLLQHRIKQIESELSGLNGSSKPSKKAQHNR